MSKLLMDRLIEAVCQNNLEITVACLEQGADPNGYQDWAKVRPLHFAVTHQALECAKILIAAGADPLAKNFDGETPFQLAKDCQATQIFSVFKRVLINTKTTHKIN